MSEKSKTMLEHRKAALEKLSPVERVLVDTAITKAAKRFKHIGHDGAIELVAALGEYLAQHKTKNG